MKRALAASLTATALLFAGTATPVEAHHKAEPLTILAVGDSNTTPGKWQAKFSSLLRERGIGHRIVTSAVGGTPCEFWDPRLDALLDYHNPDLVIILCGKNDHKNQGTTTAASMHSMIKKSKASGAHVLSWLFSYSDPDRAPQVLIDWEPRINRILEDEFSHHSGIAVADMRSMYNGPKWTSDGVHSTDLGYRTQAKKLYRATRAQMDWPKL